jgi:hypothetical protein
VNLTTQQRTEIRQTVLAGGNVPRVNNVNFSLRAGTTVPTSVRVVAVPPALIEIHPQWRGPQPGHKGRNPAATRRGFPLAGALTRGREHGSAKKRYLRGPGVAQLYVSSCNGCGHEAW